MCETANATPDPREAGAALGRHIRDQAAKFADATQEAGRGYADDVHADRGGALFGNAAGTLPIGIGVAGYANAARRPRLRERVKAAYHNAERAADQTGRLGELEYLLGKNPDVARILELVEETRV